MLQRRTLGNVVIDINHFLNIAITVRYPTHFHEMGFATGSALPSFQLLQRIFPLCRHQMLKPTGSNTERISTPEIRPTRCRVLTSISLLTQCRESISDCGKRLAGDKEVELVFHEVMGGNDHCHLTRRRALRLVCNPNLRC